MSIRNTLLTDILSATVNSGSGGLVNRITVEQASDLAGTLDSTKEYFIDGIIDMGSQQIEIPQGGLNLAGYNFDLSKLTSSATGYTMFTSPAGGSGNVLGLDYGIEVTGAGSQVYDIVSDTGFEAFEFSRINYNNCTSLGTIDNYRQGLEIGTGRFGGSPSLTLKGVWAGGYRITTSIVRALSAGMTEPLFKAGAGFTMASRFLSDINCDLPALAPFMDFSAANFPNESTVQLKGVIMTRLGSSNSDDSNITPNFEASDLACDWDNNIGMNNTFVGGTLTNTAEAVSTIAAAGIGVDMAGTWTASGLQHFDSPAPNELRHLGNDPKDFRISFSFVVEGGQGDNAGIELVKIDTLANVTIEFTQVRVINNLQGSRDVAYFTGAFNVKLSKNDLVVWQITNISDIRNLTLELDSAWIVEQR